MKVHFKTSLRIHEWLVTWLLIAIIILIALTASFSRGNEKTAAQFLSHPDKHFEVIVRGEVKNPGVYHFAGPTHIGDVLKMAEVTPEANLKRYPNDRLINKARILNIPKKAMKQTDNRDTKKERY